MNWRRSRTPCSPRKRAIKDLMTLTVAKVARDTGEYLKTQYVETVTDEDRLPHYKLFAMRWRVEG